MYFGGTEYLLPWVLGPEIALIVMTMLEKPTQKRYKTWEGIEEKFETPLADKAGDLGSIVSLAIEKKIETDRFRDILVK